MNMSHHSNEKPFQLYGLNADFYQHIYGHPITSDTIALYFVALDHLRPLLFLGKIPQILDIGCGNGALLLNIAKDHQFCHFIGVDIVPELVELAQRNFTILSDCFHYSFSTHLSVADYASPLPNIPESSCDIILANPPYYPKGTGKQSPHLIRSLGRMESAATQRDLLACIKKYLAPNGTAIVIYPSSRAEECIQNCHSYRLKVDCQRLCDTDSALKPPINRIVFEISHAKD